MKITVIGVGYIGSVISAVLSNKGHKVTASAHMPPLGLLYTKGVI